MKTRYNLPNDREASVDNFPVVVVAPVPLSCTSPHLDSTQFNSNPAPP